MRNLDTNFGLSLVEHDTTTVGLRIVCGVSARADVPVSAVADFAADLAARTAGQSLSVQVVGQDGWYAVRLYGAKDAVQAACQWIERDGRVQGLQTLYDADVTPGAGDAVAAGAAAWLHAPDDGLVRARIAATVRLVRLRREANEFVNPAALWSALTLPAPEDSMHAGVHTIPRRTLLIGRRRGAAAGIFRALTERQGSRTRALRLGLDSLMRRPAAEVWTTVSSPGDLAAQGLHLLAADADDRPLLGALEGTVGRIVAVVDPVPSEADRSFLRTLPPWAGALSGRPSLMGISMDTALHKSMIQLTALEHLSYRPLVVDLREGEAAIAGLLSGLQYKR